MSGRAHMGLRLALVALLLGVLPARADLSVVDSLPWLMASAAAVEPGVVQQWEPLGGGPDWLLVVGEPGPHRHIAPMVVPRAAAFFGTEDPGDALALGQRAIAFADRSADGHRLELRALFRTGHARAYLRDGRPVEGLEAIGAIVGRGRATAPRWAPRPVLVPFEGARFGSAASLRLPADPETEAWLLERMDDPEVGRRAMAAAALVAFESRANIVRLNVALADRGHFPGNATRVVCVHAARTLRAWEVPLPEAPCEAPAPAPSPPEEP